MSAITVPEMPATVVSAPSDNNSGTNRRSGFQAMRSEETTARKPKRAVGHMVQPPSRKKSVTVSPLG